MEFAITLGIMFLAWTVVFIFNVRFYFKETAKVKVEETPRLQNEVRVTSSGVAVVKFKKELVKQGLEKMKENLPSPVSEDDGSIQ